MPDDAPLRDHDQAERASEPLGRMALVVLPALALLAYHGSFRVPFVFDDFVNIVEAPAVHSLWPPRWAFAPRPIAVLSFALNWRVGGASPIGYHVVNLAIHVIAGLVLFDLVRRALRLSATRDAWSPRQAGTVALIVSAAWIVHPLHTSAVAYVVHRYESLACLFYLVTLDGFARGIGSPRPWRAWSTAFVACVLGCLTKEIVVTAPIVVLLLDRCLVAGSFRDAVRLRWRVHVSLAACWALLALAVASVPGNPSQGFSLHNLSALEYARSELGVLIYYLRLSIWPWPLCIDYYDWPVAKSLADVAPQAAAVAALAVFAVVALVRRPPIGFLAASFFVLLAPTSTILPLMNELVAERRMYLPLAALIVLAAAAGIRALRGRGAWALALGAIPVALWSGVTIARIHQMRSSIALFEQTVLVRPNNPRARYHLGLAYQEAGRVDDALRAFLTSVQQEPACPSCNNNAGALLGSLGRMAEAEPFLKRTVAMSPRDMKARSNLELALLRQGKSADAARVMRQTLAIAPDSVPTLVRMARLLATCPDDSVRDGAEAVRLAEQAVDIAQRGRGVAPQLAATLAAAYAEQRRWEQAAALLEVTISNAQRAGLTAFVTAMTPRLDQIRAHVPWRETPEDL
jgi:tetratricopeptide (TPR) repeat protein